MAAAGWFIVVCGGGSLALDVTALVLAVLAEECVPGVIQFTLEDPHQLSTFPPYNLSSM